MKIKSIIFLGVFLLASCQSDHRDKNHETTSKDSKVEQPAKADPIETSSKEIEAIKIEEAPQKTATKSVPKNSRPKSGSNISTLAPSSMIEISQFNEAYLISLVRKGINLIRLRRGAGQLQLDRVLNQAANDHNEYQINTNELTHKQNNTRKHEVMDRVKNYGGNFRMVGENVQYQGLQQLTTGNRTEIIPETYQQMANKMIKNWVDSPGHYDNLIESEFTEDGMAIGWNPENYAFFATHVFGSRR